LSDIDNLANLNLKGLINGELNTNGTTGYGVINAKINGKNFEIDKFHLGNLTADLVYKDTEMLVNNINGEMEQTLYNGNLALNFKNSTLQGEVHLPRLYGKSVLSILNDRFSLPFTLTGQGKGDIAFSGPFDFWKMKYQLQAELNRGAVSDESFSQIIANLNATGEKINFERVILTKPSGQVIVGGHINTQTSEPRFNLDISSQNLRVEEVDHFVKLLPKSTGLLAVTGKVVDTIDRIQIQGQVALRDFTIEGQSLLSSQGDIVINKNFLSFNGQVFGRQAQAAIQIPFNEKHEFSLKAQLRDLNPLNFLPLIKIPPPSVDTTAVLTAEVDLHSPRMDFTGLRGVVKLNSFLLARNNQTLKLQKPSEMTFHSGLKSLSPINLRGPDQSLDITQRGSVLNFNGKLLLRPFQFLVPFLENLNGQLQFDFGVNLNASRLSLAGDGSLKNGLVQLKGFPYPIKEINASLDFSQSKLIIGSVSAQLNQSPITGYGYINFLSSENIDVNIQAESTRVDLEFPPQMQTSGLVKVKLSGQWMPYTFKVDYNIEQGLVTKEFSGGEEDMKLTLAPSRYLPPQQLNQQSPTLLLDVNAKFPKGIIIKNSLLEGTATGDLRITGSPEIPVITGRVDITQGSKLYFKDKPFDILTGFVIFNPGDQKSADINPEIFINASARVTDYDISVLISGQAKTLSIKPTSQPPLSESDIFSLLALGFTSSNQDQNLTSDTQQKQTGLEVIAALSNQSKFNKQIQEKLGLNVQIAPSVDSTKNIAVPKVVVSRKLTKKINASYSRPLTGSQQSNEVKLQWLFHPDYSLNLNYQNQTDTNETSIIQNNENDTGNYGIDLEYKKEFK
jgi:translocation and assembly module TamB